MKYDLIGIDGNAFNILGYVTNAMRRERYSKEQIKEFREQATAGDYNALLSCAIEKIDEINERVEEEQCQAN